MNLFKKTKQNKKEKGAIMVEATIALTTFMFALLMILSLLNICYIQAKMGVALNSAAKEMSQYAYLYNTLNLDKHMSGEGGKSSELIGGLNKVMSKLSEGTANFSSDLSNMFSTIGSTAEGDSAAEYIKDGAGMMIAKQLVKKNLKSFKDDDPDNFLRRNHVKNGLDGLSFVYTSFLTDEDQSKIDLVVTYEVSVIKLLDVDFDFRFMQRATTRSWGPGVSKISKGGSDAQGSTEANAQTGTGTTSEVEKSSIWNFGDTERGKLIVLAEKSNYKYTSSSNGFHAFDPEKNEFTRIRSIDLNAKSYNDPSTSKYTMKNALQSTFNANYSGVSKLGNDIKVESNGSEKIVNSNPDTRVYNLVFVVPDNADTAAFKAAADAFIAEKAAEGITVTVDIKGGYGSSDSN